MTQLSEDTMSATLRMMTAATFDEVRTLLRRIPLDQREGAAAFLEEIGDVGDQPAMRELHVFLARLCRSGVDGSGTAGPVRDSGPGTGTASAGEGSGTASRTGSGPASDTDTGTGTDTGTDTASGPPADFEDLLARARRAPHLLAAHRLLHRHRALLPDRPVQAAQPSLMADSGDRLAKAGLCGVLAMLSESPPDQVLGRALWASVLAEPEPRRGRPHQPEPKLRRALFHGARAVALQEAAGDGSSLLIAYGSLAGAMGSLNDLRGMRHTLNRALDQARGRRGVPGDELADTHAQLAGMYVYRDVRYREALGHLDEVDALTAQGVRAPVPRTTLLDLRARAWQGIGAYGAAVRAFRELLALAGEDGTGNLRRETNYRLAQCMEARGRGREALRILLAEQDATGIETAPGLPQVHHLIARTFIREGAPERRRPAAHMLLLSLFDLGGRPWGGLGEIFVAYADLALLDGEREEAAGYLRDALAMTTGAVEGDEWHRVEARPRMLGFAAGHEQLQDHDLGESLSFLCHQVRLMLGSSPQFATLLLRIRLIVLERLARVAGTRAERAAAEAELTALYTQTLTDDIWYATRDLCLPVAALLADTHGPATAEAHLRATLDAALRNDRADDTLGVRLALARIVAEDPERRQVAFDELWECRAMLLRQREGDHGAQSSQEWAGLALPVYEELLALLLGEGEPLALPDGRPAPHLAFDLHEEVKSRGIVEDLSRLPLPPPPPVAHVDPRLLDDEARLLPAVRRLLHESEHGDTGADASRQRQREHILNGLLDDLYAKAAAIGRTAPRHERLRRARGIGLPEALRLVEAHAPAEGLTLASYFIGERHSFCFVLTSGESRLRTYRVPTTRAALHTAADAIRRTVDGDPDTFPPRPPIHPRRPTPLPLGELSAQLLPFQDALAGRELLCVAPHGPLAVLPLHALRLADGAYVAERAALTYTPSLSALEYLLLEDMPRPHRVVHVSVASEEELADPAAPDFEHENTENTAHAGPGDDSTRLTGTAATPRTVMAALARHDLAYVACHGHSGDGEPDDAALILTDGRRHTSMHASPQLPDALPFLLRARDITAPPTGSTPATVVLRACSAGWHDPAHLGEDFTGLTQALFREGTRVVVAPVWRVNRDSSAELLDGLVDDRRAGEPMWRALWRAQRRLLSDASRPWLAHPYHWAGFVPLGDWR
ncbi:CHAT domain-containing protein [Actinomycetota bacterium Odt1-20B]